MEPLVLYEVGADGVAVLTLNDPGTRNAMYTGGMIEALVAAIERLAGDARARAAVLTGAGPAFSAGADLKKLTAPGGLLEQPAMAIHDFYREGIQQVPLAVRRLEVPLIAAVNGPSYGAGCDIACMCDIRIASETASFCEVFVRLGVVPGDGGAWFLPRLIGPARYAEMAFTGEPMSAEEALRAGLVSRVVPPSELMPAALDLARRIAANPPVGVRMVKRLLRAGESQTLEAHLEMTAGLMALCHTTADHREAVSAYMAKRQPRFTGA